MANQMIALQTRNPQLPDPSRRSAQFANMMNTVKQQETAERQANIAQKRLDVETAQEARAADTFKVEQAKARVSTVGKGLIGMLRDPSDANLGQTARTFQSVGMDPKEYEGVLSQMAALPDANARKMFALEFIAQTPEARDALKFVMPDVKETKIGDSTVFIDNNPASNTLGQELFRVTVAPEPVRLNQSVVGSTVMNTNPLTGVSAEATIGDPTQNSAPPVRTPTLTSTGVRSPYSVGGGMGAGQPPMGAPAAPQGMAPPAAAVNTRPPVGGAPGRGGDVFSRMIQRESGGKQFAKSGAPLTSPAGAIGIAQVMPGTAPEAAKLAGLPFDRDRYRNDANYNLALGKAYFEKQLRDFGGNEQLAAAAYNAGPGAIRRALQKGGPDGWINNVPRETRNYVNSVFGGGGSTGTGTGTPTGAPKTVSQALTEKEKARTFNKFLEVTGFDYKTGKDPVAELIKKSTGGGGEKLAADIMAFIPESMGGGGTKGMDAIGALNVLTSDLILTLVPEGKLSAGVSNEDRKLYERLVGDINNPSLTRSARLSAWNQLKTRMSRLGGVTMPTQSTPTNSAPSGRKAPSTPTLPTLTPEQVRANPKIKRWKRADNGKVMTRK